MRNWGPGTGGSNRWRQTATLALGLVLPVQCAGCGRWDVPLCDECQELLHAPLTRAEHAAPALAGGTLPSWSIGTYTGALRTLVLAWKSQRRTDVAGPVLLAGELAGQRCAGALIALGAGPDLPGTIAVVPAPSGWRRRLARRLVVRDLAIAVGAGLARGLAEHGRPAQVLVVDLLRRSGGPAHQGRLGSRARARARRGSLRAVAPLPGGVGVLLVDDVQTTGTTLHECARVVGADRVLGALVLAATPGPTVSRTAT